MKKIKISVFLPCRVGSKRVINKNTRKFCDYNFGLFELKLQQLEKANLIHNIIISTNDDSIIEFAEKMKPSINKELIIKKRPDEFASDDSLQGLIEYIINNFKFDHLLWTHVTSPLFTEKQYDQIILEYKKNVVSGRYDSLMTVQKIQTFLYAEDRWISHDRSQKKWPRTQDLKAIYAVNSAAFIVPKTVMTNCVDRIGERPYLFDTPWPYHFDIDNEDDFITAEELYKFYNR